MEKWKDIKGFEGLYKVSNMGRVKSLSRIQYNPTAGPILKKEKILRPGKGGPVGKQYYTVSLWKDNVGKSFRVNCLVGIHFIPNPKNLPQLNHINRNKLDNRALNLEWCTNRENSSHAVKHKSLSKYTGVTRNFDKWESRIRINGKLLFLGRFKTELQASKMYQKALVCHGLENRYL